MTGSFTLTIGRNTTGDFEVATASAADVQTSLEAFHIVGPGGVRVSRQTRVNDGARFIVTFLNEERTSLPLAPFILPLP